MTDPTPMGWAVPGASRKAHYFTEGEAISLCRKWMHTGLRFDDDDEHRDNCADCKKRVLKLRPGGVPK